MTDSITTFPNNVSNLEPSTDFFAALCNAPQNFLRPSPSLHAAAILAAKQLLDPLANDIADAQARRRRLSHRVRNREHRNDHSGTLQLREIHINGFGMKQVWEQGRRVLEAAHREIDANIAEIGNGKEYGLRINRNSFNDIVAGSDNAFRPIASDEIQLTEPLEDKGMGRGAYEHQITPNNELEVEEERSSLGDDKAAISLQHSSSESEHQPEIYTQDPYGLNDRFFSIDDFNKQTQFLEHQDARGEADNPSDENEVDWNTDPLATRFVSAPEEDEESNDDDQNSSSGDMSEAQLDATSLSDEDEGVTDKGLQDTVWGVSNATDIMYTDFFEPPPKRPSKTKRMRALPKTQPESKPQDDQDAIENDIQRAISDVRRDIFDTEDELSNSDDDAGSASGLDLPSQDLLNKRRRTNLSTHEKQQAKIRAEIERLEALNVSKRDWQLLGEARAIDRPVNSLIEEDLDFERVGKPVPVATVEVSEEIEQLIKRRVIAREFDEVIRRRPDAAGFAAEIRRGRIDLIDDQRPQQGLADLYEQEHLRKTDPNYVDPRSAATKNKHKEIDQLWKELSYQLDLLSNLHFKPKRVEVEIKQVEDKPVISMEDARPTGARGDESQLAPQEIYKVGEEKVSVGEVVRKGGASVSKEEMSRDEKLRRRRREKERLKKARANRAMVGGIKVAAAIRDQGTKKGKSKRDEKADILSQLRRGGVKVVGERGEVESLGKDQKKTRTPGAAETTSALRL